MTRHLPTPIGAAICLVLVLVGLVGCTLPGGIDLTKPTPISFPTLAAATPSPTTDGEPTLPSAGPTDTPAPPTARPPELEEPVDVAPLPPGTEIVISQIHMFNSQQGWALGGEQEGEGRVLRTTDGGESWIDVTPPLYFAEGGSALITIAYFLDPDRAWALRYAAVEVAMPSDLGVPLIVWSTEDAGTNWQLTTPRYAPFIGTSSAQPYLQITAEDEGWLLARAGGAGMHQHPVALLATEGSSDGWQVLLEPFSGQGLDSCYKSGMAFSPEGLGVLTIASCPITGSEIRMTSDGGRSWQSVALPDPGPPPDLYDEAVCESHSPQWVDEFLLLSVNCRTFAGGDEEFDFIYRLEPGGRPLLSNSYPGGELQAVDDRVMFALGREIHRTLDGGVSWQLRKRVAWDGQFSFVSSEVGWAVARAGDEIALVSTSDGANRWQMLEPVIAGP